MDEKQLLKIGVPSKGRLSELAGDLLNQAGLRYRRQNRGLQARVSNLPIEIIFLRTDDIPTLCAVGAIDMGITGSDLIEESALERDDLPPVQTRMNLGVGRCRLAVCVPEDTAMQSASDLDAKTIATSFPAITHNHLRKHSAKAKQMVTMSGSVEIMMKLNMADAIVDLVETGSTLAANRLKILDVIDTYETVLIQSPHCADSATADRVVRRLQGVVLARDYSLVEYNVPKEHLSAAEQITPGYNSPTVTPLEDGQWCSVRAMVKRSDVIDAMERLEKLGAHAIFETSINNCRL